MKYLSLNAFFNECGAEILKAVRAPEYILPTLILPVAFYALFTFALPNSGANSARYLLATYGVFAVMGPAIFGFGVGVANERDRGWLKLKRASPAPSAAYIGAKIMVTLIFASLALIPIYLLAGFGADITMARSAWFMLFGLHLLSVLPFALIGLTLGFSFNSNGAIAVSNIFFLGMAALGGLWIPAFLFPTALQKFATTLPSYQLAEIALAIVGAPSQSGVDRIPMQNLMIIAIMTIVLAGLAIWAWSRQRN
ncbi:ABC transporter permease [bacterium AH-315-J19]|nr:ABC transporter permease [Robiginitomaculum sp.]MBN4058508.1 ABC transporter permease [bacterium AH-315-J19]